MSVIIETLVQCDGCGENCAGDDRSWTAREIRRARSKWGWKQVGKRDYCEVCVAKGLHRHSNSSISLQSEVYQRTTDQQ